MRWNQSRGAERSGTLHRGNAHTIEGSSFPLESLRCDGMRKSSSHDFVKKACKGFEETLSREHRGDRGKSGRVSRLSLEEE